MTFTRAVGVLASITSGEISQTENQQSEGSDHKSNNFSIAIGVGVGAIILGTAVAVGILAVKKGLLAKRRK